ncbi:ABC-type glycerol-3-phosphate transport system, substrate-binding protein [Lachnospiraceae bacterium NE2001]|nr:ABC-type glycerol-3-phosphate transport system, substrate-binding protein [Lachnospiraceae bacterium NE2001]
MKKFKKAMALSLALAMGLSLVACGGSTEETTEATEAETTEAATEAADDTTEAADDTTEAADETTEAAEADLSSDGKVLNIQCWNDEFANRLKDHYPGYEANDPDDATAGGKIGDIEVKFTVTPSDDNAYQNNLDAVLPENGDAADDDKVDLFLVEADYALKYVNTDLTMPVADLGIDVDSELANQYQYTKDIVTDADGNLKGVSWQGCPGVLIYNREAAKEVLGSDDPDTVQDAVKDWDTFNATAKTMNDAGYKITATANDTYRVFSNNVSTPWVVDGKIQVDDNIKAWVDMSKEQVDAGYTTTSDLWSDDWSKGFYPDGKVFAYFGPAWLINFCMNADDPESLAGQGLWGATTGPQGFYWGGTWICAANGTDNPALVADIIRKLTTDESVMTEIVKQDSDFVNNKPAMEAAATDDSYAFDVLGGQNPLGMFCEGADKIDLSNLSEYDQGCNESFQAAMKDYFEGNTGSYEEALDAFYTSVTEKYPELSY